MPESKREVSILSERDVVITGSQIAGRDIRNVYIYNQYNQPDKEELNNFLRGAAQAYCNYIRTSLYSIPASTSPYLFLRPFDIEHHHIFFGRERVIAELHPIVMDNRLTVLHARSGAGKSSLLHAGLGPRLIRDQTILPIFARTYNDPVSAVIDEIANCAEDPIRPKLLPNVPLQVVLQMLAQRPHHPPSERIVIVLDQFEEIFSRQMDPKAREAAFDAIADCIEDRRLPVHFILAIRREYLGDLDEFKDRLPSILDNRYRLAPMGPEELLAAITCPVERLRVCKKSISAFGRRLPGWLPLPNWAQRLGFGCTRLWCHRALSKTGGYFFTGL